MSIHRSAITRYAARAAIVAGAVALSTAGASSAFAAQSNAHPNGFAPTEECLNWTGTIQSFPGLTKVAHSVTDVISGTLNNCSFDGTAQTFSGTFFGTLTGSASGKAASLSGHVAVSWPQDAGLNPTISPVSISGSANAYSLFGTISNGAGSGEQLEGSYDVVTKSTVNGGTSQSLVSTAPFGIYVNEG
jgi:hypothetical protein